MNKLDELLEETNFTQEEYQTYRKVQKNYYLYDLQFILNEMLDKGTINEQQFGEALEKADIIVAKYDAWLEYDWESTMKNAINWVVKGAL
jgi:hypothetical protein|nr:MAG TPA: transcription initiation factor [Caudoviricetes sp.]